MDNKVFAIAIDGPVASGKGTIASLLAHKLQGFYLSTGAMYRALALYCVENNVSVDDDKAIVAAFAKFAIEFKQNAIFLNGVDVTEKTKTQAVANAASIIALFPKVRALLVEKQQSIAKAIMDSGKIVVSEGRDTGTKVFPESPFKIFLTATPEVRAQRRFMQYRTVGDEIAQEDILQQIADRDRRDSERVADPLPKHPENLGYFIVDSSNQTEEQTLDVIIAELEKRGLK